MNNTNNTNNTTLSCLVQVDQAACIKQGYAVDSTAKVELNLSQLTPTEREYVAEYWKSGNLRPVGTGESLVTIPEPTHEALVAEVKRQAQWLAQKRTEKAAYEEAKLKILQYAADRMVCGNLSDEEVEQLCAGGYLDIPGDKQVHGIKRVYVSDMSPEARSRVTHLREERQKRRKKESLEAEEKEERRRTEEHKRQVERLTPHLTPVEREMLEREMLLLKDVEDRLVTEVVQGIRRKLEPLGFMTDYIHALESYSELQAKPCSQKTYVILDKIEKATGLKGVMHYPLWARLDAETADGRKINVEVLIPETTTDEEDEGDDE